MAFVNWLKQIPWVKVQTFLAIVLPMLVIELMPKHPDGLLGVSWTFITGILVVLGIYKGGDMARHVVPDSAMFQFLRTGDGSAPVSAKLALKLEREAVAEKAVSAMPDKPTEVKAEVTATDPSVVPPRKE